MPLQRASRRSVAVSGSVLNICVRWQPEADAGDLKIKTRVVSDAELNPVVMFRNLRPIMVHYIFGHDGPHHVDFGLSSGGIAPGATDVMSKSATPMIVAPAPVCL